jgi:hypothetical protein
MWQYGPDRSAKDIGRFFMDGNNPLAHEAVIKMFFHPSRASTLKSKQLL